jgi:hypothetical protein
VSILIVRVPWTASGIAAATCGGASRLSAELPHQDRAGATGGERRPACGAVPARPAPGVREA